jgi:hypothetical protein
MLKHLTIKINLDNGEAELTPKSQASINEMIKKADLLDYDLLSDMHFIFKNAFEDMEIQYHKNWDAWLDDRIAKIDQQIANKSNQDAS